MLENFFIHVNVDDIALNLLSNQPLSRNRTSLGFLLLLVTRESDFLWFWSLWAESVVKKLYLMINYDKMARFTVHLEGVKFWRSDLICIIVWSDYSVLFGELTILVESCEEGTPRYLS